MSSCPTTLVAAPLWRAGGGAVTYVSGGGEGRTLHRGAARTLVPDYNLARVRAPDDNVGLKGRETARCDGCLAPVACTW